MKGIYDTKGNEWVVSKGDKGADVVRRVEARGFQYIILPPRVLAGLQPSQEDWIATDDLFTTRDIRVIRQADIMDWLEKEGMISHDGHSNSQNEG